MHSVVRLAKIVVAICVVCIVHAAQAQVTLMSSADPTFSTLVEESYPGLMQTPGFKENAQMLALLKNDGLTAVGAYSVLWRQRDEDGSEHTVASTSFMFRVITARSDVRSLRPRQVRLLAPFFNLSPDEYKQMSGFSDRYPSSIFSRWANVVNAKPALDGAITGVNEFVGSNLSHFHERYQCVRMADRDEVLALMSTRGAMNDPVVLRSALDAHELKLKQPSIRPDIPSTEPTGDLTELYRHSRLEAIAVLRAHADANHMSLLADKLQRYAVRVPFTDLSPMGKFSER